MRSISDAGSRVQLNFLWIYGEDLSPDLAYSIMVSQECKLQVWIVWLAKGHSIQMPLSPAQLVPLADLLLLSVLTRSALMPITIGVIRITPLRQNFSGHDQAHPIVKPLLYDSGIRMLLITHYLSEIEANTIDQ